MANGNRGRRDRGGDIRAEEVSAERRGRGYFTTGTEWFPEDVRTGEVAQTWRHRGYGGSRGMRDDYHYLRGDTGAMGAGGGGMGYGETGQAERRAEPQRRPWPRMRPKNYRRTDERICDDICERLARARGIDVSDVTVEVESGIVTLTGTIADRRAKFIVEDIADQVGGVDEVRNNIRVPR